MEAIVKDIEQTCKELKDKKTWIKKEFQEILDNINENLNLSGIEYKEEYLSIGDYGYEEFEKLGLGIYGNNIQVVKIYKNDFDEVNKVKVKHLLDMNNIRKLIEKLPEFLNNLYWHIENENEKINKTINKLKDIKNSLNNI